MGRLSLNKYSLRGSLGTQRLMEVLHHMSVPIKVAQYCHNLATALAKRCPSHISDRGSVDLGKKQNGMAPAPRLRPFRYQGTLINMTGLGDAARALIPYISS